MEPCSLSASFEQQGEATGSATLPGLPSSSIPWLPRAAAEKPQRAMQRSHSASAISAAARDPYSIRNLLHGNHVVNHIDSIASDIRRNLHPGKHTRSGSLSGTCSPSATTGLPASRWSPSSTAPIPVLSHGSIRPSSRLPGMGHQQGSSIRDASSAAMTRQGRLSTPISGDGQCIRNRRQVSSTGGFESPVNAGNSVGQDSSSLAGSLSGGSSVSRSPVPVQAPDKAILGGGWRVSRRSLGNRARLRDAFRQPPPLSLPSSLAGSCSGEHAQRRRSPLHRFARDRSDSSIGCESDVLLQDARPRKRSPPLALDLPREIDHTPSASPLSASHTSPAGFGLADSSCSTPAPGRHRMFSEEGDLATPPKVEHPVRHFVADLRPTASELAEKEQRRRPTTVAGHRPTLVTGLDLGDSDSKDPAQASRYSVRGRGTLGGSSGRSAHSTRSESPSGSRTALRSQSVTWGNSASAATIRRLVHPAFASMPDPEFRCSDGKLLIGITAGGGAHDETRGNERAMDPADALESVLELAQDYTIHLQASSAPLVVRGPPEHMMAALSLALHALGVEGPGFKIAFKMKNHSAYCSGLAGHLLEAWHAWRASAVASAHKPTLDPFRHHAGSCQWVTKSFSAPCGLERLACACSSLRFATALRSASDLISNTKLLSWLRHSTAHLTHGHPEVIVTTSDSTVIETAVQQAQIGQGRVAAVIVASASQHGGDFLRGKPYGDEEEACARSTLFISLREAARRASAESLCNAAGQRVHIPEDGVVLSPGVEVFRSGANKCYEAMGEPVRLAAVLSVSMPNLGGPNAAREIPRGSAFLPAYKRLLEQKFEMVVQGVNRVRADVLAISDVGCGKHGNDPMLVGRAFGRALLGAIGGWGDKLQVIVCGNQQFQMAVRRVVAEGQGQK